MITNICFVFSLICRLRNKAYDETMISSSTDMGQSDAISWCLQDPLLFLMSVPSLNKDKNICTYNDKPNPAFALPPFYTQEVILGVKLIWKSSTLSLEHC